MYLISIVIIASKILFATHQSPTLVYVTHRFYVHNNYGKTPLDVVHQVYDVVSLELRTGIRFKKRKISFLLDLFRNNVENQYLYL